MKKIAAFAAVAALISSASCVFAEGHRDLYALFEGKSVKAHVAGVTNSTGIPELDPRLVKDALLKALKERKSIHFQAVEAPDDAELLIRADLKGFLWTDHDPVDMIMGLGGTAADAAVIEDYASLEADFEVVETKTGRLLWRDRVRATITKKPMSREESIPLVSKDLAKTFVKDCFAKKRKN